MSSSFITLSSSPQPLSTSSSSSLLLETDRRPENYVRTIEKFKQLIHTGNTLSNLVFAPVLKACSKVSALGLGKQIHAQSVKHGFSSDVFIQTSLISMYSSCGQLDSAFYVFDKMPHTNVVTWTTVMNSCLRLEKPEKAVVIFRNMQKAGIKPDQFTVVSLLTACSRLGALNLGKWVHAYMKRIELELTVFTGTALVDMYCKCGSVDDGLAVFYSMEKRNVQSWNAMLHGLSVNGRGMEALCLFREMEMEMEMEMDRGVRPNGVTFVGLLSGCSHNGLVEEGRLHFDRMQNKYGIEPTVKHYGCMVDLLGRAGLLEEAFKMVSEMPIPANAVVWGSLLSACRTRNNVEMAECVNQRIIQIEEKGSIRRDTSHYVIMSNMYDRAGLKEKKSEVRKKIGKKPRGKSWIEIGTDVYEFAVEETSNPMLGKIKQMLNEVMKKIERDDAGDTDQGNHHSEKLAVAFGLLSLNSPMPIRITKNLRICEDCHGIMKLISKVYQREIVVRDCNRFHRFVGGLCSCNDYW